MNLRTNKQNTRLHALLNKLGMDGDDKADLVKQYTQYRTEHSSEMSEQECHILIKDLDLMLRARDQHLDKKRKRVISHLIEAGYTHPNGRANMEAIHQWVKKQKFKKHLNDHTSAELSQLIHAAQQVRDHYLSKLR